MSTMSESMEIIEESLAAGHSCRECGDWSRAVVTVGIRFPNGSVWQQHFCGRVCAARQYPRLVAQLPEVATTNALVRAASERIAAANREAVGIVLGPRENYSGDAERREWSALCSESRRLNRRSR